MQSAKPPRILLIHYYFPPAGSVATLRNYNVALEFSKVFEKCYLISPLNKAFLMDEDFDLSFLEKTEVDNSDYRTISEKHFGNKGINEKINVSSQRKWRVLIRKVLDSYPCNLIWGEGGIKYIFNAIKSSKKLIENEKITHVYSSFRPFADHYIAYRLKKKFPGIRWIADFRDLPVDENRSNVFFPFLQHSLLKRIFSKADVLCTVSDGLKKILDKYNRNVIILRSGTRRHFQPRNIHKKDIFQISYTGSLYPGHQDPNEFFQSIQDLLSNNNISASKFRINYAGKDERIWKEYINKFELENISNIYGKVNLSQAIQIQHESQINLMLSWSGPFSGGIITGKFSDYLAARKAILCIIKGEKDQELEDIFRDLNAGLLCYSQEKQKLSNFILKQYDQWSEEGTSKHLFNEKEIEKFNWNESIKPLITYIFSDKMSK